MVDSIEPSDSNAKIHRESAAWKVFHSYRTHPKTAEAHERIRMLKEIGGRIMQAVGIRNATTPEASDDQGQINRQIDDMIGVLHSAGSLLPSFADGNPAKLAELAAASADYAAVTQAFADASKEAVAPVLPDPQ